MCELFGLSSSFDLKIKYSLHEFAKHGGQIYQNKSGWGIAYHRDKDAILVKEASPASDSHWVKFIESHPISTNCAIAHVRYATAGPPNYANTHPFIRELGGQRHVFAHNGSLPEIYSKISLKKSNFQPIGQTDSEYAFCALLERLTPLWHQAKQPPKLEARLEVISEVAQQLRSLGPANFLYSDGEILFVHSHRRRWEEKDGFSEPKPPGLSFISLKVAQLETMGLQLQDCDTQGIIALVASVPITKDNWQPLSEGMILALDKGKELARYPAENL